MTRLIIILASLMLAAPALALDGAVDSITRTGRRSIGGYVPRELGDRAYVKTTPLEEMAKPLDEVAKPPDAYVRDIVEPMEMDGTMDPDHGRFPSDRGRIDSDELRDRSTFKPNPREGRF